MTPKYCKEDSIIGNTFSFSSKDDESQYSPGTLLFHDISSLYGSFSNLILLNYQNRI